MSTANFELPPGVQLTQPQIQELRRIFTDFDRDNSGYITRSELTAAMKRVSFRRGRKEADQMMTSTDASGDGRISFQEFVEATYYTTNERGESNGRFRGLVDLVAAAYVRDSDQKTKDYLESYRFCPPPVFMILFSIVEIALFIYWGERECGDDVDLECPLSFSSELAFRPGCRDQVWRFITYVLVHAGIMHILFNILIQLVVGLPLEMVHGPGRVCTVYLMGGLAGSLASSVCDPLSNLVGASAAVYALVGAHVADVFLNWAEMPFRWVRAGVLFVLIGLDFSISIYTRYFSDQESNVSYTGHLAGFLMGCTLGTRVLKNLEGHNYENVIAWVGFALAIGGIIFALFWNIFYDYDGAAPCPK